MDRPLTPPSQFQHRDNLIGYRSSYIPKPEGRAGPQSYNIRRSFHTQGKPSIEVRRSLHGLYGRDFCRTQRHRQQAPPPSPSPPKKPPTPPPTHSRRHIRSQSLTALPVDNLQPSIIAPNSPAKNTHTRSRSFNIPNFSVSQLLEPPPPRKKITKGKAKWRHFSEHLWHEKSKLLLKALILTPPRQLYIERKNEVQNRLFHEQCHSAMTCQSSESDRGQTNFDSFIAGYVRNMNNPPIRRRGSRTSPIIKNMQEDEDLTTKKWAKWRQYPINKREPWLAMATSTTPRSTRNGISYVDFISQSNSYSRRASLRNQLNQN